MLLQCQRVLDTGIEAHFYAGAHSGILQDLQQIEARDRASGARLLHEYRRLSLDDGLAIRERHPGDQAIMRIGIGVPQAAEAGIRQHHTESESRVAVVLLEHDNGPIGLSLFDEHGAVKSSGPSTDDSDLHDCSPSARTSTSLSKRSMRPTSPPVSAPCHTAGLKPSAFRLNRNAPSASSLK